MAKTRYSVWVPAGAENEKEVCKTIMTGADFRDAVMEGNPFGECVSFLAEESAGNELMERFPGFQWKSYK